MTIFLESRSVIFFVVLEKKAGIFSSQGKKGRRKRSAGGCCDYCFRESPSAMRAMPMRSGVVGSGIRALPT